MIGCAIIVDNIFDFEWKDTRHGRVGTEFRHLA